MTARLKLENLLKVFRGKKIGERRRQQQNWGIMNKKEGNNKWGGLISGKKEQLLKLFFQKNILFYEVVRFYVCSLRKLRKRLSSPF